MVQKLRIYPPLHTVLSEMNLLCRYLTVWKLSVWLSEHTKWMWAGRILVNEACAAVCHSEKWTYLGSLYDVRSCPAWVRSYNPGAKKMKQKHFLFFILFFCCCFCFSISQFAYLLPVLRNEVASKTWACSHCVVSKHIDINWHYSNTRNAYNDLNYTGTLQLWKSVERRTFIVITGNMNREIFLFCVRAILSFIKSEYE